MAEITPEAKKTDNITNDLVEIVQPSIEEIVLIDGYVDVGTLNLLAKKNEDVSVVMYTLKSTKL